MIAVLGHGCFDVIPRAARCPECGELIIVDGIEYALGGPTYNTGGSLARLGARTHMIGGIGDDIWTEAIHNFVRHICHRAEVAFKQENRVTYLLTKTAYPNSVSIVIPHPDRGFLHQTGTNEVLDLKMLPLGQADEMAIAHFGYPALLKKMSANAGEQTVELFTRLSAAGVTTSLDHVMFNENSWAASFDWVSFHQNVLPWVDVFCPSFEELTKMLFPGTYQKITEFEFEDAIMPCDLDKICQKLFALGTKIILLKLGKHGLYLRTCDLTGEHTTGRGMTNPNAWSNREIYCPAFYCDKPLTTGAGDAAIAGLLCSMNSGLDPDRAVAFASATARCCCNRPDATSGILTWEKTWEMLQNNPRQDDPWFVPETEGFVPGPFIYYGPRDKR
jgi:sugar/nucleoside kinase (ribokinase family)